MFNRRSLSMALHFVMQNLAQPAISQPPDQQHIGRRGRQAVKNLRASWAGFGGGWGRRKASTRSKDESALRIAAAIAKRERRCARNLRLAGL